MDLTHVKVAHEHEVVLVTLNRPDRYNAWHSPMRGELTGLFRSLAADTSVRAIVITGAGSKAFCAGQDLAETETYSENDTQRWMEEWRLLYTSIRDLEVPVIAALNGVAAGSGMQLALLCDVRIGHAGVRIGQPEINAGIPSTLGTWLLREMLGHSRTVQLVLSGRLMDAREAYQLGLIHDLVPEDEVRARAVEVATELAAKPKTAMRLNKRHMRSVTEAGFLEAETAGRKLQAEAYASGEPQFMMRQFFARRNKQVEQ